MDEVNKSNDINYWCITRCTTVVLQFDIKDFYKLLDLYHIPEVRMMNSILSAYVLFKPISYFSRLKLIDFIECRNYK